MTDDEFLESLKSKNMQIINSETNREFSSIDNQKPQLINDNDLERMVKILGFVKVNHLNLWAPKVTSKGFSNLLKLKEVSYCTFEELNISYDNVEKINSFIEKFKSLKVVVLEDIPLNENSFKNISKLKHLDGLIIHLLNKKDMTDNDMKNLINLKNLKRMSIENSELTDEAFENVKNMKKLETLYIDSENLNGTCLKYFAERSQSHKFTVEFKNANFDFDLIKDIKVDKKNPLYLSHLGNFLGLTEEQITYLEQNNIFIECNEEAMFFENNK